MMAQRGSVIAPNFNSVNNPPAVNKQWNNLMRQTGLPHRIGVGNAKLENPYTSQDDCPVDTIFEATSATEGKCMPITPILINELPTSQADCREEETFIPERLASFPP